MAIGARAGQLQRLVLRQGGVQVAAGLVAGLPLAVMLARTLALILFDVNPNDGTLFAAVLIVLIGVAALACVAPTRRITRVEPVEALRQG